MASSFLQISGVGDRDRDGGSEDDEERREEGEKEECDTRHDVGRMALGGLSGQQWTAVEEGT